MVKEVAGKVGLLDNLRSLVAGARAAGLRVFFVPHRRLEPGDYKYVLADAKLLARKPHTLAMREAGSSNDQSIRGSHHPVTEPISLESLRRIPWSNAQ